MGQSIYNDFNFGGQPMQPTQSTQSSQFGQFTQPHRPTSIMDLIDQFNTFKKEYAQLYGNTDPQTFANQVMQSGQIPQNTLDKIGQIASVLRNFVH